MSTATEPRQRKKQLCISLDEDAHTLLRAMVPGKPAYGTGRLLSELIRREARERAGREQLLAGLHTTATPAARGPWGARHLGLPPDDAGEAAEAVP